MDSARESLICIVDDDEDVRDSLGNLLRATGHAVLSFAGPDEFLGCEAARSASCLVLDVQLQSANGLDLQQALIDSEMPIPVILMSGYGDIPMTVRAMRAGAVTFLAKPFGEEEMLFAIDEAVARDRDRRSLVQAEQGLRDSFDSLTPRERDVFGLVTAGLMNKQIAGRLELSEITVKIHRGNLMRKMQAESLADLVRMAESLGARQPISRYHHA